MAVLAAAVLAVLPAEAIAAAAALALAVLTVAALAAAAAIVVLLLLVVVLACSTTSGSGTLSLAAGSSDRLPVTGCVANDGDGGGILEAPNESLACFALLELPPRACPFLLPLARRRASGAGAAASGRDDAAPGSRTRTLYGPNSPLSVIGCSAAATVVVRLAAAVAAVAAVDFASASHVTVLSPPRVPPPVGAARTQRQPSTRYHPCEVSASPTSSPPALRTAPSISAALCRGS